MDAVALREERAAAEEGVGDYLHAVALGLGALAQGKANWLRWSLLGCMFLLQVGYTCLYILGFPVY